MIATILDQTFDYISNAKKFTAHDWLVYGAWIGLMLGLFFATSGFVLIGVNNGVVFPAYVYLVPIGAGIFTLAIALDTIGHRTIYKNELKKGEGLVHSMTITAGVTSCLALCLCYNHPDAFTIPALVLIAMSFLYTVVDEAMHWGRYLSGKSDPVEMWSHFFIILGHSIMISAWTWWYFKGYSGVAETLRYL
jgi:hypothetical protein